MSRSSRTIFPTTKALLKPEVIDGVYENIKRKRQQAKAAYDQSWIQTSATSFQKLVRIYKIYKKKKAVPEYLNARCQFLPGDQLQNLLIPTALHLLPASSGPAP